MPDDLQTIPHWPEYGRICAILATLGVEDLAGENPELMFKRLKVNARRQYRPLCSTCFAAVYYATEKDHEPELLKWWVWQTASRIESILAGLIACYAGSVVLLRLRIIAQMHPASGSRSHPPARGHRPRCHTAASPASSGRSCRNPRCL